MKNNIEELLVHMKKRPQMFVGKMSLELIATYIDGFLASHRMLGVADDVDIAFFEKFYKWVGEWIKKNVNKELDFPGGWGYVSIISDVWEQEEERVKMFFILTETFFKELHEKNK